MEKNGDIIIFSMIFTAIIIAMISSARNDILEEIEKIGRSYPIPINCKTVGTYTTPSDDKLILTYVCDKETENDR